MFFKKKADNVYRANINDGCLATDRISFDGEEVGYMYREHPDTDSETPDSGWRFFAGNETDEYVNTPENIKNFSLDTICAMPGAMSEMAMTPMSPPSSALGPTETLRAASAKETLPEAMSAAHFSALVSGA